MYSDEEVRENLKNEDGKVFLSTDLLHELAADLTAEAVLTLLEGRVEEARTIATKADTLTDVAVVLAALSESLTSAS